MSAPDALCEFLYLWPKLTPFDRLNFMLWHGWVQ